MIEIRRQTLIKGLIFAIVSTLFACSAFAAGDFVFPMPRPSFRYFYYYTRADQPATATSNDGQPLTLKPETLIRFVSPPDTETAGEVALPFETVPLKVDDPVIRGTISLSFLGETLKGDPNGEQYEEYRKAVSVYAEIEKKNHPKPPGRAELEAKMTLRQVLTEFHNEKCVIKGRKAKSKDEFIQRWDQFVKGMASERGKQLARNARALDLTARTVLFESQTKDELNGRHPKAMQCQWDLIALSIHSRAFRRAETFRKSYGADYEGDVAGVATDPQFNVWRKNFVDENPQIFNCFLFKNYDGPKGETYKGIVDLIPKTIGIETEDGQLQNSDATDRFEIVNSDTTTVKTYTHYYHPKGMGRCNVGKTLAPKLVSGFLRIGKRGLNSDESTSLNYKFLSVPVINGKVLGHTDLYIEKTDERRRIYYGYYSLPVYEWKIRIYQLRKVGGRDKWVAVPAEEVFDAEVSLVDSRDLTEKFETDIYACLPQGIHPQCLEEKGLSQDQISQSGSLVPLTWFNEDLRGEMQTSLERLGFNNSRKGLDLPEDYRWNNPTGITVQIRCVSPGMEDKSRAESDRFPSFGGRCDPDMMMFSRVDQ